MDKVIPIIFRAGGGFIAGSVICNLFNYLKFTKTFNPIWRFTPETIWKLNEIKGYYSKDPNNELWKEIPISVNYYFNNWTKKVVGIFNKDAHLHSETKLINHLNLNGLTDDCYISLTKSQEEKILKIACDIST